MVPKVCQWVPPADAKRHPKVTEVAPQIAVKIDAGKNSVFDASKP